MSEGATRSGKTYLDYYKIPWRLRHAGTDGLILILGNTQGTLERNILDPLRAIWTSSLVGRVGSGNKIILFGREAYALGADNIGQIDRLRGSGLVYAYGDEMTTWHPGVFDMLKSRLDKPGACFDGTCNPDNPGHWFKKFLDSDADIYRMGFNIDDNPFIDPIFKANLKKEYAGTVFYDRFINGLWVAAQGIIYDCFYAVKHVMEKTLVSPQHFLTCDYGTANPCVFLHMEDDGYNSHAADEYFYDSRKSSKQKTDEQYADDMGTFIKGLNIPYLYGVYVDPSAASFITLLKQRGYNVLKPDNSVMDGIHTVGSMLNTGRLTVSSKCVNVIREFSAYTWDIRAQNRGEDAPVKEDDHTMDALRYFCHTRHKRGQGGFMKVRM